MLDALEDVMILAAGMGWEAIKRWPSGPQGRVDQVVYVFGPGLPENRVREALRAMPVLRAVPTDSVNLVREGHLRVLLPIHRDYGEQAVRAIWDSVARHPSEQAVAEAAAAYCARIGSPRTA
ncbi:hypothetical protein [Streptomyces sp. WM6378]|uniref:hypothetical protein n=1 Tax=Streptomyces sp. WM6378 TaxID=1415557 RepID=UPI0006ADDB21|nr:hypothetical protein [Streptomyces sp. WM6378]KOU43582.1 hypothetical protein ADK54_17465 [Streptomyces sp. WM6378]